MPRALWAVPGFLIVAAGYLIDTHGLAAMRQLYGTISNAAPLAAVPTAFRVREEAERLALLDGVANRPARHTVRPVGTSTTPGA